LAAIIDTFFISTGLTGLRGFFEKRREKDCIFDWFLATDFTDCTEEYSHEFDVDGLKSFGYKKDSV